MLEFDHIKFAYPNSTAYALDDVSFQLERGERICLLGPNGSGKSTLAKLANGMLLPSMGKVRVDGLSTDDEDDLHRIRMTLGVISQDPENQIVSSTVVDEVAFGPENLGLPRDEIARRVSSAIEAVGIAGKETRDPNTLSGGEKQRLVIAGMLAMEPEYLVLDEPSSMLDAQGRSEVMKVIADLQTSGHGIVHITHDLGECLEADRVIVLDQGSVVFVGDPGELLSKTETLAAEGLTLPSMLMLASRLREGGVLVPSGQIRHQTLAGAVCDFVEGGPR